nr:sensor histidine kinase [uncultured Cupriavidus sp.]
MRLADFILRDMGRILREWESFASTLLPAAENMTPLALRDHAPQILQAIAKDLATPQTRHEQREKSLGRAPTPPGAPETAAQTHALMRARRGFNINQMVAEYRALRASVLRLWIDDFQLIAADLDDLMRFNEAIDQAVAESVDFFEAEIEESRNLLLGMLGHDLRGPLQTIQMTAAYLTMLNVGVDISEAADRLERSTASMNALLDDLNDFNRAKLGLGIDIAPDDTDLTRVIGDGVDQLRGAHPDHLIELEITGNLVGVWDGCRLRQLLSNLVINALRYGSADQPVCVAVSGNGADVELTVTNSGPAIDPVTLTRIFDPLSRGPRQEDDKTGGIGLGLYIASEIARAHEGKIQAFSDEHQTVFKVSLPRDRRAG